MAGPAHAGSASKLARLACSCGRGAATRVLAVTLLSFEWACF